MPTLPRVSDRVVIWVLSFSTEANDRAAESLLASGRTWPRPVLIECTALGGQQPQHRNVGSVPDDPRLVATVLVLEKAGLTDGSYRKWVERSIAEVARKDVFRLFVLLHDLTLEELYRSASPDGDSLLSALLDTVQVTSASEVEKISEHLGTYLECLDDLGDQALRKRISRIATNSLSAVATLIQIGCIACILITGVALLGWLPEGLMHRITASKEAVALMLGLISVPVLGVLIFLVFHRHLGQSTKSASSDLFIGVIVAISGLLWFWIYFQLQSPTAWLLLGMVLGVLLDGLRRRGRQARRALYPVDCTRISRAGESLPHLLRQGAAEASMDPLWCPLLSDDIPRVFLSYSRASSWGRELARVLFDELKRGGTVVYFDREGVQEGSSWRKWMNAGVGRCNVFLVLLDPISATREWTAAELEAALAGRALTGQPHLVVLEPGESKDATDGSRLPAFQSVLDGQPTRIKVTDKTVRTLASELRPDRYCPPTVLPNEIRGTIFAITAPFKTALVGIGTLSTPAGLIAGAFAILGRGWIDCHDLLSNWNVLLPAVWVFSYWFGFVSRMIVASRFEWRDRPRRGPILLTNALAALGLAIQLAPALGTVSPLAVGWAIALIGIGWVMGESCVYWISAFGKDATFMPLD